MSLKINYNVSAMLANNSLKLNDNKLTRALERLSSGYKINSAKDDAAGLAIARRMNAQIRGLDIAAQDAKDGVSVVEIADGALAEVHDMLQRMNELAIKASNATVTDDDRKTINDEIIQLKDEITRIGKTTEFNGQGLFDGSFDLKGYTNNNDIKVNYYSDEVRYGKYELELPLVPTVDLINQKIDDTQKAILTDPVTTLSKELAIRIDGDLMFLTGENGYEIRLDRNEKQWSKNLTTNPTDTTMNLDLDLTGYGAMTLQIGANEGQTIDIRIPELSLLNSGLEDLDLSTYDGAIKGIDQIDSAIQYVSQMRSRLGAYQNRLEHTQSNLETASENVTGAYSRIMDTDMATEMTSYTNLQIVSQAATSILAQANQRPSQMLQLLQ